jgi:AraC-like DNA-binding protein
MRPLALQGVARFRPAPDRLELPDPCCDVSFVRGRFWLCGPVTRARASPHVGEDVLLLKISIGTARALLGVPVCELTDRIVPLEDVAAPLAGELAERLERGALLELVVQGAQSAGGDRRFKAAAAALGIGEPVARVADAVNLCERQLERLVHEHAGLAPKAFTRIVRFRRAVLAAAHGGRLAAAAAEGGYADQAHFNRDVQDLTGRAPRKLLPNVGSVQDLVAGEI